MVQIKNLHEIPSIPEFYKGRDIFITGGSGFMGKVLIEKLLRSCPDINKIFILLRPKKNISPCDRIEELQKIPVFDRLHKECPDNLKKMIPINGDVCSFGLGISEEDIKHMENVSIVFHAAANVRFDDLLSKAVIINIRGTRETLSFSEKFRNLLLFVHVSTTFAHANRKVVEERLYPPNADWQTTIKLAELFPDILNQICSHYISDSPNTYIFSKSLAEQVVIDYKERFPVIIFRPSIVISSVEEPMPGWVDNFYGPIAIFVVYGLGLSRISYCDANNIMDTIAVDTCIRAMLIATWKRCTNPIDSKPIIVYNASSYGKRLESIEENTITAIKIAGKVTFDNTVWPVVCNNTKCKYYFFIKFILVHLSVAYILDGILKVIGKKQIMSIVKMQRILFNTNMALSYFSFNSFVFKNDEFLNLNKYLKISDCNEFNIDAFFNINPYDYFHASALGGRRYLFNQKDENLAAACIRYKRLVVLDKIIKIVFLIFFGFWIIKKIELIDHILYTL